MGDALTATRSYRAAMSREAALEITQGDSGRTLDPTLFTLFAVSAREQTPTMDLRFPAFAAASAAA